ncbi:MAG: single-stranded DNA-binding protein [Synergistaceae bacterium]|nr:single-stranded DNA-binding protein [Synergistaceae bacterium]
MARGFNKVILIGNLARDPEVRYTVDKRAWARFTLAVNYSWKNKNGEFQEGVDFIPIVAWGPLGDRCGRYLKKGSAVCVEGKIKVRSYEARDGSGKKYSTDVEAAEVMFIGSRRESEAESGSAPGDGGGYPSFGDDADFGKSIREKGFGAGEFPMDVSELGSGSGDDESDAEIPF